jgi:hypothetical protein
MLDQGQPRMSVAEIIASCLALLSKELTPSQRQEVRGMLFELYQREQEGLQLGEAERMPDDLRNWAASELRQCADEADPFAAVDLLLRAFVQKQASVKQGRPRVYRQNILIAILVKEELERGYPPKVAFKNASDALGGRPGPEHVKKTYLQLRRQLPDSFGTRKFLEH